MLADSFDLSCGVFLVGSREACSQMSMLFMYVLTQCQCSSVAMVLSLRGPAGGCDSQHDVHSGCLSWCTTLPSSSVCLHS